MAKPLRDQGQVLNARMTQAARLLRRNSSVALFGWLVAACGSASSTKIPRRVEAELWGRWGATMQQISAGLTAPAAERSALADTVELTISAVGDCAIGDLRRGGGAPGSFSDKLARVKEPSNYPFSAVAEIFQRDDLSIANLEGTLTTSEASQNPVFSIRGKPEYAHMFRAAGVELVNIENNHSYDYGIEGYEDTKRALQAAEIAYVGRGRIDRRTVRGISIVNLAYLGGPKGTQARMVAAVKREKTDKTIVIVSFHWGVEGAYATHPDQRRLGKAAIDAGADLVLGHHPHVLQGIETYRGRHIVHSLGNFVFGANSQPEDMDSIIYQEIFTWKKGKLSGVRHRVIPRFYLIESPHE